VSEPNDLDDIRGRYERTRSKAAQAGLEDEPDPGSPWADYH
jgi:hypothetical protein